MNRRGAITVIMVLCLSFFTWYTNAQVTFTDATKQAQLERPMEDMWGSVFADFNSDGWQDLYNCGWAGRNRLYLNNGDGTFSEVGGQAGVATNSGVNACVADYDNDGDVDIYVTRQATNWLYRNDADGTFAEVGASAGVNFGGSSWGAQFLDYDNDGWLDLFVASGALAATRSVLYHNEQDGTFTEVSRDAGVDRVGAGFFAATADYDNDGYTDIFLGNQGQLGVVYSNNGDGTFTDVTDDFGLLASDGRVVFGDYDNDGDLDMRTFTRLFRNEGQGGFRDVTKESGLRAASGVGEFVDFDNDGDLDVLDATKGSLVLHGRMQVCGEKVTRHRILGYPFLNPGQILERSNLYDVVSAENYIGSR